MKYFKLFIVLFFFIFACKTKSEDIKQFGFEEEKFNEVSIQDFETTYSSNALVKLKITAPELIKLGEKQDTYFECNKGIVILFYNPDLSIETSLTSKHAVYYDKKNIGRANGDVIITNKKGSVLRTEELFLDEKKQKIYTQKLVTINDIDGSEIIGKGGFESNLSFTAYQFTNVNGKIPIIDSLATLK